MSCITFFPFFLHLFVICISVALGGPNETVRTGLHTEHWNRGALPQELEMERNKERIIIFVGRTNKQNTETRLVQAYKEVWKIQKERPDLLELKGSALSDIPSQGTCAYLVYSIMWDQHTNSCNLTFTAYKMCFSTCQRWSCSRPKAIDFEKWVKAVNQNGWSPFSFSSTPRYWVD